MEIKHIDIALLEGNRGQVDGLPANPRKWTQREVERIAASLQETPELLEARPLVVVPHGKKYVVLGGNLRLAGIKHNQGTTAPCAVLPDNTSAAKLKEIVIKDNSSFGEWDFDLLEADWDDMPLDDWGIKLSIEDEELPEESDTEVVEDEVPTDAEARVQYGDVWMLGKHVLMCGDSTKDEDVARLMNGERADIAFTSPPYGVNDGSLREHKVAGQSTHADDNFYLEHDDNMGTWPDLIEKSWQNMNNNSDQQFINIQMLRDNKRELARWCARHADNLVDMLIWDKGHAAPQMQSNIVNNNFEFIYVFGDDKASRVIKHGNFHGNYGAIVRVGVGQNEYADIHKAVFPVALPAEILNINGNAKSVLDLFGGTGTTMIAAEQLGRKCYMMEIDPHYCDIIIKRWEVATGGLAIKK